MDTSGSCFGYQMGVGPSFDWGARRNNHQIWKRFISSSSDSLELVLWFGAGIEVSGDLLAVKRLSEELLNSLKLSFLCSCKSANLLDLCNNFEERNMEEHHLKLPVGNPHQYSEWQSYTAVTKGCMQLLSLHSSSCTYTDVVDTNSVAIRSSVTSVNAGEKIKQKKERKKKEKKRREAD